MENENFTNIEKKWQEKWSNDKVFKVTSKSKIDKCYVLEMFPYPSGAGLHMGHALNYTIGDVYARYKRMKGFNVLYPMGYDAFGLPAENAAIKAGEHPKNYTQKSMTNFIMQQKALGLSYDWDRLIKTCDPEYYKWNQWFFLKFYEQGLVYRKKSAVNWCSKCNTVLANEQVHAGKCWRHEDTDVEMKQLEQWFIKTTKYAEELLQKIPELKWPDRIKTMQENWIGKSYGTEITFKINNQDWTIFTTRPDTLYGITFMVISSQHARLMELVTPDQKSNVENYLKQIKSTTVKSATEEELNLLEKEGVFTGSYAEHPITKEKVPVYAGNFVVADYAGGMVMAVPAHDQRDFEFAKKYNIPIKLVIKPDAFDINVERMSRAYTDDGILINSQDFSGLPNRMAIDDITAHLEKLGIGKKVVQYKLRDWLISRQRYWGTPIPMIYCDSCGIVPAPIENLPIALPENVTFGEGNPLKTNQEFINVKCPKCNSNARRETDTMDTFFDSSWYYLRYADNHNKNEPFDKNKVKYWMTVDQYIGGAEHACMHLIYARFFTKALRDMGMLSFDEPFPKLFNQGMLHGSDGNKMSKSLGNVVNPIEMIDKFSADSLRFNLMSLASPDKDSMWNDRGIESSHKYISRIYNLLYTIKIGKSSAKLDSKLHKTIKEYSEDLENFKYNLAIIKLRALFENIEKEEEISKETALDFLKMLHPFCPHLTEELWEMHNEKGYISTTNWPIFDETKIDLKAEAVEKYVDDAIADIKNLKELVKIEKINKITLIVSPVWKYKLLNIVKESLIETRNAGDILKKVMSTELKQHGQDITKIVPGLIKDPSKIPETILDQDTEFSALQENTDKFSKNFECDIEIVIAENSKEAKVKNAMPGKPALLLN